MLPTIRACIAAPLMLCLVMASARPAGAEPLLEDPPDITGVSPTPPGEAALTLGLGLERARSGRQHTTYGASAEFELGIAPSLDLRLSQDLLRGRAGPRGDESTAPDWGGTTALGLRWQIAEERGALPAIGLFGAVGTQYGRGRPTEQASAIALLSRSVAEGERPGAMFLNLGWTARLDPEGEERSGRYLLAAGLAQNLAPGTSLGLSYLREQQERGERDLNLVQAGLRHRVAEGAIIGVSGGAGIGRDSPRLVVGLSLKLTFGGE